MSHRLLRFNLLVKEFNITLTATWSLGVLGHPIGCLLGYGIPECSFLLCHSLSASLLRKDGLRAIACSAFRANRLECDPQPMVAPGMVLRNEEDPQDDGPAPPLPVPPLEPGVMHVSRITLISNRTLARMCACSGLWRHMRTGGLWACHACVTGSYVFEATSAALCSF